MIIDAHVHLGKNQHINARATSLIQSMDVAGIDKALVFAGRINGITNEEVMEEIAPYPDRLHCVAAYHRYGEDRRLILKKLASLYEMGKIKAVKFYTGYEHFYPEDVNSELGMLEEVGCPAIFHCGDCLNSVKYARLKYAHPLGIDDVANEHPKMNFIIAHMGFPWHRDAAEVCYKNTNVFADISGFVYGKFTGRDYHRFDKVLDEFMDIAGQEKLIFGTDWPISDQTDYVYWEKVFHLSDTTQKVFKL